MLAACGVSSVSELFAEIPAEMAPKSFDLPAPKSEMEVREYFHEAAGRNAAGITSFLGGGFYDHFIPSAIDALVSRSEFYTAYTPYQPELSQGTLQAIYEYQTHIARLTGMEVANASMYDGGTALCDACRMAVSATDRGRIVVDGGVNPLYIRMLRTYTANLPVEISETPASPGRADRARIFAQLDDKTAALVLQNPSFFGAADDHADIVRRCHELGILVIQVVYPMALAVLKTPAETCVDIAVGEGQSLGLPLSFGGPYLGFLATTSALVRKMPGRLVGRTKDSSGRCAFVLTLQAREQHIRREKATSNICTNSALCALRAHIYLSLFGREGFKEVAHLCHSKAAYAQERLGKIPGVQVAADVSFFNEFVVLLPIDAGEAAGKLLKQGMAPGLPLGIFYPGMEQALLVAVTEKRTRGEIDSLAEALERLLCQPSSKKA